MLILNNISKKYQGSTKNILNNINLKFDDKGLVCILGNSGCGKSTLLNLIGCLDAPTEGYIMVDDKVMNKFTKKDIDYYHNKYVGFIYQNYNLIDYLNIVDNIELINKNSYINELLDYLSLTKLKKHNVKKISGGERQRVAIARALINDPKILLCDEPTGALDSKNSLKIMKKLKDISQEKLVIVVTHNEELAKSFANRIIRMEDGEIVSDTKKVIKNKLGKYSSKKVKISFSKIFNIIFKNITSKYKRNILTVLAFSIGLISLSLVIGISSGFNKSMEKEERNSLSKYPIFISETSTNIEEEFKDIFKTEDKVMEDKIYAITSGHKNIIDKKYVDNLKVINNNLDYQVNTYFIDNKILNSINKPLNNIKIIKGRNIQKEKELLLVVKNNKIDASILESINLKNKEYSYDEIINYEIKIKKEKYKIVGIASINEDSYLTDINGLLCLNEYQELPLSIMLYPKDYENKKRIINHLNKFKDILYTDYSTTIKNLSTTAIDAISVVLLAFSLISLLVSTIMIGIISYISVMERIKDIGILKSLGVSNRIVKSIFLGENIILAIISSTLSISICLLISLGINNVFYNLTGLESIFQINLKLYIVLLIISILLSILGSYLPIKKTQKLKIIDCLRYEY